MPQGFTGNGSLVPSKPTTVFPTPQIQRYTRFKSRKSHGAGAQSPLMVPIRHVSGMTCWGGICNKMSALG